MYIIPNFNIKEKKVIPKFLSKSNEINVPFIVHKIKIEKDKTYLIEQEIFGGKAIDFIIFDSIGDKQYIFAFQVTILKNDIFDENKIKDILEKMDKYLIFFLKI